MGYKERALAGALSGTGGTLVLSGLREVWSTAKNKTVDLCAIMER